MNRVFTPFVTLFVVTCLNFLLIIHPVQAVSTAPQTNLSIAIQAPANPVIAGTTVQYQVTVTNQGPAQAVNVVTTLTLPAQAGFQSVSPSTSCSYAISVISCTLTKLDISQSFTFTVTVDIAPDARGTLLISGTTRSNIADPDQNNNSQIVSTVVQPYIDLQLKLNGLTPNPIIAGAGLVYQFQVSNLGSSAATSTTLDLNFPNDTLAQVLGASPGVQCLLVASNLSCALGTIAPAGVEHDSWITSGSTITVEVQPKAGLAVGTILSIAGSIDAEELEAITNNNFVYRFDTVNRMADLAVQVGSVDDTIMSGTEPTYTFVVQNYGPSNDDQVIFSGSFDPKLFTIKTVQGPSCQVSNGLVTCSLGTLVPQQHITIVVQGIARAVKPATLQWSASVSGDDTEATGGAANEITRTVHIQPHVVYVAVAGR